MVKLRFDQVSTIQTNIEGRIMPDLIDEIFGEGDPAQNQLELYQDQLKDYQKQLNKLDGVDTPEAAEQRQRIGISIYEVKVKMEDVRLGQQKEADQIQAHEPQGFDLFDD